MSFPCVEIGAQDKVLCLFREGWSFGLAVQCAFPGQGHGEHQSIERQMVEAFADQLAGQQQHAGLVGRQCIQLSDQRRSMLSGHSVVQQTPGVLLQESRWHQTIEFGLDGVKVFRSLGQHQHFTAAPLDDGVVASGSDIAPGGASPFDGQRAAPSDPAGVSHHPSHPGRTAAPVHEPAVISEKFAADRVDGAAGSYRCV